MLKRAKNKIREIKDFPQPGKGFKDISPLVEDAASFNNVIDELVAWARKKKPDIIAGIESRGFLFAAPMAHKLGLGVVAIRKKGKFPSETVRGEASDEDAFEYLETHMESIDPSQKVIIVDDLIASGSTSVNAIDLMKKKGGEVVGFASVVDVVFLKGIEFIKKAHPNVDVLSLIKYEE
ncbi:MAG: adenine phosphoribosyltransferase [Candidatus Aminicenantes bacterium]|nr:MAG: adenine phosphoribosyltransferase [Candidatus Aminicenantes bacterium]